MATNITSTVNELTRKDIRAAAALLTPDEARYLVNLYYQRQADRMRTNSQIRELNNQQQPNALMVYLSQNAEHSEALIKKALGDFVNGHPIGKWLISIYGIGPIIAAGLLAHVDITKTATAGGLWRFAGLDPTVKWEKGQKRPFNADLKKLCWHAGQSWMKLASRDECFYGKLYKERKAYEIARNDAGENAEQARLGLTRYSSSTQAYKHCLEGKLPPAQIDARARRWTVKIFLSHLHKLWYEQHYQKPVPAPFAIAILGHAHMIEPPPTGEPTKVEADFSIMSDFKPEE